MKTLILIFTILVLLIPGVNAGPFLDPIVTHLFQISIGGIESSPFDEMKGLSGQMEVTQLEEEGENKLFQVKKYVFDLHSSNNNNPSGWWSIKNSELPPPIEPDYYKEILVVGPFNKDTTRFFDGLSRSNGRRILKDKEYSYVDCVHANLIYVFEGTSLEIQTLSGEEDPSPIECSYRDYFYVTNLTTNEVLIADPSVNNIMQIILSDALKEFTPIENKRDWLRVDDKDWDSENQQFLIELSLNYGTATAGEYAGFTIQAQLDIFDKEGNYVDTTKGQGYIQKVDGALKDEENYIQIEPLSIDWDRNGGTFSGIASVKASVVMINPDGEIVGKPVVTEVILDITAGSRGEIL